jgi:hypothetical protein
MREFSSALSTAVQFWSEFLAVPKTLRGAELDRALLGDIQNEIAKTEEALRAAESARGVAAFSAQQRIGALSDELLRLQRTAMEVFKRIQGAEGTAAALPAPAAVGEIAPISVTSTMREMAMNVPRFEGSVQPIILNQDMLDEQLKLEDQFHQQRIEAAERAAEMRKQIERGVAEEERRLAEDRIAIEDTVQSMKMMAADSAAGFLRAIGAEHRGAAIAALAIEKALAVKQLLIQSHVAAMHAFAQLGPIAGAPVAAKLLAMGRISAGFVAATGLVEALQLSHGGTGAATLGTSANPLVTSSSSTSASTTQAQASRQTVVHVHIDGPLYGFPDFERAVTRALQRSTDRDVVIISSNKTAQGSIISKWRQ